MRDFKNGGYEKGISLIDNCNEMVAYMHPETYDYMFANINRLVSLSVECDTTLPIGYSHSKVILQSEDDTKEVELIEIDKDIVESISILNKKGYHTVFCCSGHIHENVSSRPYVIFDKNYYFDSYPEGWVEDEEYNSDGDVRKMLVGGDADLWFGIEFPIKHKSVTEKDLSRGLDSLLKWVNNLKKVEEK